MKINLLAMLPVLWLTLSNPLQAAIISSDFGTDAGGWVGIPGEGSVTYVATGGNPGGHIRVTDIGIGGPLGSVQSRPANF